MKRIILVCSALSLAACTQTVEEGRHYAKNVQYEADKTYNKVKELATYTPPPPPPDPEVPRSYCYRVMQDVTCYNQPLEGAQDRLVGWQGATEEQKTARVERRRAAEIKRQEEARKLRIKYGFEADPNEPPPPPPKRSFWCRLKPWCTNPPADSEAPAVSEPKKDAQITPDTEQFGSHKK